MLKEPYLRTVQQFVFQLCKRRCLWCRKACTYLAVRRPTSRLCKAVHFKAAQRVFLKAVQPSVHKSCSALRTVNITYIEIKKNYRNLSLPLLLEIFCSFFQVILRQTETWAVSEPIDVLSPVPPLTVRRTPRAPYIHLHLAGSIVTLKTGGLVRPIITVISSNQLMHILLKTH